MMYTNYLNILSIAEKLNEINEKFNAWTDKFTDNGVVASVITVVIFIIACIAVNNFANKWYLNSIIFF